MRLIFSKAPKFDNRFQRALFFVIMAFRQLFGKAPEKYAATSRARPADGGGLLGAYVCMFEYPRGGWISVCCSEPGNTPANTKESVRRMKALVDAIAPQEHDDRRA
ncbi:hypothetical protein [Pluralibacter gergoviae]|uniref:hypothetical protein n=1 Tax=Pluralibacter gergoviae TaxID=61647 RepID=UPI0012D3B7CE|nr:hypothetical protein [Pluralibacter gergoviae]